MTVQIGGVYRHFKGGLYLVLTVAEHTETKEVFVVYGPHDGCLGMTQVWVRPLTMFEEHVERDGYSGPRFSFVESVYRPYVEAEPNPDLDCQGTGNDRC